jgi:cytochrome c-type biogenesis protein
VSLLVAFGAGFLSFASPCCLPLVPAYLANLAGTAAGEPAHSRGRAFLHAFAFVAGFSSVFTALWLLIAALAIFAAGVIFSADVVFWAQRAGGVVLIVLGLQMVGLISLPLLASTRQARVGGSSVSLGRSFLVGVTFGAGWSPCVGPYLGAIFALLLATADFAAGGALLLAFTLGLGLPFLAMALAFERLSGVVRALRRRAHAIELVGGTVVIAMGVLLVSGRFTEVNALFGFVPAI